MEPKQKILVAFIQDRSGSMSNCWDETLNGYKTFVEELKKGAVEDNKQYLFSLTVFDTEVINVMEARHIEKVDPTSLKLYGPRGSTALYDAAGKTIQAIEKDDHGAEKIICVIVTDGMENASREWTKDGLHASIEEKLKGKWTFTYLGTQPETWSEATGIGVGVGSVANYVGTHAKAAYGNTVRAVRSMSVSAYSNSRSLMADYVPVEEERAAHMKIDRGTSAGPFPGQAGQPTKPTPPLTPPPVTRPVSTRRWK